MSRDNKKKVRKDTAFWTKWAWDEHAADTMHLSALEEGVYMRLLRLYYRDYRGPLPDEVKLLARKVLARTEEERQAVDLVLGEFFYKGADGLFHHTRCDSELADAEVFSETRAKGGKAAAAGLVRDQSGRFSSQHVPEQAPAHAGEQPARTGGKSSTEQNSKGQHRTERDSTEGHSREVVVGDDSSSQHAPPKDKSGRVGANNNTSTSSAPERCSVAEGSASAPVEARVREAEERSRRAIRLYCERVDGINKRKQEKEEEFDE